MQYKIRSLQVINKESDGYLSNIIVGEELWISNNISKVKSITPEWTSTENFSTIHTNKFYTVWLEDNRILQVPKDRYVSEWVQNNEVSK